MYFVHIATGLVLAAQAANILVMNALGTTTAARVNQHWALNVVDDEKGYFHICNVNFKTCLGIVGNASRHKQVFLYPKDLEAANLKWKLNPLQNTTIKLEDTDFAIDEMVDGLFWLFSTSEPSNPNENNTFFCDFETPL